MKLRFHACPKCRGDLEIRRDIYGMFISCLQCGLQRDLDAPNQAIDLVKPEPTPAHGATVNNVKELLKAA